MKKSQAKTSERTFTCVCAVLCVSVPVQPPEQQHGVQPGPPARLLHQPLRLRQRLQRADALALRPAQLHLRGRLAGARHPLQHGLPRAPRLPGHLPAVQHGQVRHMDGECVGDA